MPSIQTYCTQILIQIISGETSRNQNFINKIWFVTSNKQMMFELGLLLYEAHKVMLKIIAKCRLQCSFVLLFLPELTLFSCYNQLFILLQFFLIFKLISKVQL